MRRVKLLWMVLPLALLLLSGCAVNRKTDSVEEGMAAIENRDYTGAIEDFELAISLEEDTFAAFRGKGIALMGLGRYGEAAEAFDRALELMTDSQTDFRRDTSFYKASALYRGGEYSRCEEVCSELILLSGEASAYYLRGACYMKRDAFDQAKLDFDSAVERSGRDYELYLNIYSCYAEKSRSADGAEYLERALSVEDSSENGRYQKARIYFYLENYESARGLLLPLAEKHDEEAMELLGRVYLELEDTVHARKLYQDLLSVHGESAASYNGLVLCDLAEGAYESAMENIVHGLAAPDGEGRQELMYNAIVAEEYRGDFAAAFERAESYVKTYPADEKGQREYLFLSTRKEQN